MLSSKKENPTSRSFQSSLNGMMRLLILTSILLFINKNAMTQMQTPWTTLDVTTIRLAPHQDLKQELMAWAKREKVEAAVLITCVGSLEQIHLRYANQEKGNKQKGHYEILSLVGHFSQSSAHLHLCIADSTGTALGGHLLEENRIYTTAEITIGKLKDFRYDREVDSTYGYQELAVKKIHK